MIKDFLTQLGKTHEIAEALTAMSGRLVTVGSIYQWPYRGEVPERWRFHIAKLAKKKRIAKENVPEEVRGFMQ